MERPKTWPLTCGWLLVVTSVLILVVIPLALNQLADMLGESADFLDAIAAAFE